MNVQELRTEAEKLMAAAGRPVSKVVLSDGETTLEIEWAPPTVVAAPPEAFGEARPATATVEPDGPAGTEVPSDHHLVRAPLVGTFYRSASPTEPAFVELGAVVKAGDQLGIVEAMKLMNPIVADVDGVVAGLPTADGEMVEFDQVVAELAPPGSEG